MPLAHMGSEQAGRPLVCDGFALTVFGSMGFVEMMPKLGVEHRS
jgi:hypothetical protein